MALISFESGDVRDCGTIFQLAQLLNTSVKNLLFFAYNNDKLYTHYKIRKKSGGEREISAPTEGLKAICRKLADSFNEVYCENPPSSAHGFVLNRSIVTNAEKHVSKGYVLNIDLENFFGSINSGRVMGLLKKHPFNFSKQLASVIVGIITHNNSLPQGSPTSPIISNMICRKMDKDLIRLAARNNWIYSRYADDITFSSNMLTPSLAIKNNKSFILGESIQKIINKHGFSVNKKKTRLACPNQSKWVTGIKVNKELNVSRNLIRNIRSALYLLEKKASESSNFLENTENQKLLNIVRGKISHIGNVKSKNNITYIKLYNRLCDLSNNSDKRIPESNRQKYKESVLIIKTSLGWGSGFFINKDTLITAAHIIGPEDKTVDISIKSRLLPVYFKSASIVHCDKKTDIAVLKTYSQDFLKYIFSVDYGGRGLDNDTSYISVGYGGFRRNGFSSDVSIVDQKIVQMEPVEGVMSYYVDRPMWAGMSGGPIISQKTGLVVGYIIKGAHSLSESHDVKSYLFRSINNVPEKFRSNNFKEDAMKIVDF